MSVTISNGISDREWREIAKLSPEDREALLNQEFPDATVDELEEIRTKIQKENEKYLDKIKDQIQELRDARKGLDKESRVEHRELERELKALENEVEGFSATFGEFVDEKKTTHNKRNIKASNEHTLTNSGLDFDGSTFRINIAKPAGNIFDDPNIDDQTYLQNKGIIDASGAVLIDVNKDSRFTQADIDRALTERYRLNSKSKLVYQLDATTKLKSLTFNSATKEWTLIVANEKGETATIITDAETIDFHSGLTAADVPILTALDSTTQKQLLWQGVSVYSRLHENEATQVTDPLRAIPGYAKLISDAVFDQVKTISDGTGLSKSVDDLKEAYKLSLGKLFSLYEKGLSSTADVKKIWDEIFLGLDKQFHLNTRDKAALFHMLVKAVALHGNENLFKLFFDNVDVKKKIEAAVETHQNHDGLTVSDKITILLLELHGSNPGKFANVLGQFAKDVPQREAPNGGVYEASVVKGPWSDTNLNARALQEYLRLVEQSDFLIEAHGARSAFDRESALSVYNGEVEGVRQSEVAVNHKQEYDIFLETVSYGYHQSLGPEFGNKLDSIFRTQLGSVLFDPNGDLVAEPYAAIKQILDHEFPDPRLKGHALCVILELFSFYSLRFREAILPRLATQALADLNQWNTQSDDPAKYIVDRVKTILGTHSNT